MSKQEQYKPTPEEMKKAEEMMTNKQKKMSEEREYTYNAGEEMGQTETKNEKNELLHKEYEKSTRVQDKIQEIKKQLGELDEMEKGILSKEKAENLLNSNGFKVTKVGSGEGDFHFKMWAEHSNGFSVSIMQPKGENSVKLYLSYNGENFWIKKDPFDGKSSSTSCEIEQLDALLARIASGEFKEK